MNRTILVIAAVGIAAGLAIISIFQVPRDITTAADQEAAANNPTLPVETTYDDDGNLVKDVVTEDPFAAPADAANAGAGQDADPENATTDSTRQALAEIDQIVDEYTQGDAAEQEPTGFVNNESDSDADRIGQDEATDPAFIRESLSPQDFSAERVVALIEETPGLTEEQRIELQVAVQAIAEYPEARAEVLSLIETILIDQRS